MGPITNALIAAIDEAADDEFSFDPFSIGDLISDETIERNIEVISSTFTHGLMVHIYRATERTGEMWFVASQHGDGGICVGRNGPVDSLAKLRAGYETSEGWTEYD